MGARTCMTCWTTWSYRPPGAYCIESYALRRGAGSGDPRGARLCGVRRRRKGESSSERFARAWRTEMPLQKPGEIPNRPGEYIERAPRGGQVPDPRTVTIEEGDRPLPPTQEPGRTWERERRRRS